MTTPQFVRDLLRCWRPTSILDIGANPIDGPVPYREMLDYGLCLVTGVEPQPNALEVLEQNKGPFERYLPDVIADGRPHRLKVTKAPGMTSLLTPDTNQLRLFTPFADLGTVIEELEVQTRRLDDLEIEEIDLLKIDAQGSELMVFQNGRQRLSSAVAVHTEVSFVPLYLDQPTFGDIDTELRSQGFVPHSMPAVKRWPIAPTVFSGDANNPGNQLLEADIVYIRDIARPESLTNDQLTQLAMIAFHIYGSTDLTIFCITELQQRGYLGDDALEQFLQLFDA